MSLNNKQSTVNILLAIKGHANNNELLKALNNIKTFNVNIENHRRVQDFLKTLQNQPAYDLIICDDNLTTARVIQQLNVLIRAEQNIPTVLVANKLTEDVKKHSRAISAIHTLIIDEVDLTGLQNFLEMSIQYSQLNKSYAHYKQNSGLANSYSYRSCISTDNKITSDWVSDAFEHVTGYSIDEVNKKGGWIEYVNPEDIHNVKTFIEEILENKEASFQYRIEKKDGSTVWLESHAKPEWDKKEKRVVAINGNTRNISERKLVEKELENRANQQAAITDLGRFANTDPTLKALFNEAVRLTTKTLDAWLCEIFTLQESDNQFLLSSALGTDEELIDKFTLPLKKDNEVKYASEQSKVIVIKNLREETRFKPSRHLKKHKVVSGLCAPISTGSNLLGVLCAYKNEEHEFNNNDVNFIESISTILASIATQETTEIRLKSTRQVLEHSNDPGFHNDSIPLPENPDDHISAIVQTALELRTRDTIMSVTSEATKALFQANTWEEPINDILGNLGHAVNASRAYVYENHADISGTHRSNLHFEWVNDGIEPQAQRSKSKNASLSNIGLARFEDLLAQGEIIVGHVKDFPEESHILKKHKNAESILLVPIFVGSEFWGYLGFDACDSKREWATAEIDALRIAANMLGAAIERKQGDDAIRAIIEGTASKTGKDFFKSLVKHLANAFQADYCYIAESRDNNPTYHMEALWATHGFGKAFDYEKKGTPCEKLMKGNVTFYPDQAFRRFPEHLWLKKNKIQAYIGIPIMDSENQRIGHIAVLHTDRMTINDRDIQILKVFSTRAGVEMERQYIENENRHLVRILLESPNLIMTANLEGEISFKNPACDKLAENLKLHSVEELLPSNHKQLIQRAVENESELISVEHSFVEHTFQWNYHFEQDLDRIHLYAIDMTERRILEDQLRKDAFHDPLTGLPNRSFFNNLLNHSIERANRRNDYTFAVLFLDLDRFKIVNDSLGHVYGDLLLQNVAKHLQQSLRPGDYVARFGGDEFAVLLDTIVNINEATNIADRIQKSLSKPIKLDKNEAFTSASIGIALSDRGYADPEEILRDADIAMYSAKQAGKARYAVFDARMHEEAVHVLRLEIDLRHAIENNELEVYYQPIYSLVDKEISGFEALVRWNHPEKGFMEPDQFVPLAEEMGLIRDIDQYVLYSSINQLKLWRKQYKCAENLKISINLSAVHFNRMDILANIGNALEEARLPPDSLKLEITESVIMESTNLSAEIFSVLNQRGMQVSIDDFGVGYSSLSRLVKLPIDTLKIDRSFIDSMVMDTGSLNITRAIIDLAHDLDLEVIAEGVETSGQFQILGRMGCHYAQGYFISRPLPAEDSTKLLENPLQI